MTMDLLCQGVRDACWESSESLGFPWSTVTGRKAFLSPWTGCDSEGEGCGERIFSDKLKL